MFRDGRTSVSPVLSIDLAVAENDWGRLKSFYQSFSGNHDLEFDGGIDRDHNSVSVLSLSMCKEPGLHVETNEQKWRDSAHGPLPDHGISITVYRTSEDLDWRPLARDLVAALNQEFPDRVRFRDGGGKLIPMKRTRLGEGDRE